MKFVKASNLHSLSFIFQKTSKYVYKNLVAYLKFNWILEAIICSEIMQSEGERDNQEKMEGGQW